MDWASLKKRLTPKVRYRTGPFIVPSAVLEVEPGFVAGARLDRAARQVQRVAVREFGAPAFHPLPSRSDLPLGSGLQEAIRSVVETIDVGSGSLGLLLPDGVVRVGVLAFETLPSHHNEADELVRWRLKELLPFDLEDARISYQFLRKEPGNIELLAIAARGTVLAGFEAALDHRNGGPALILPATMALLPLVPETEGSAQVLVHVCSGWVTTVVVVGDRVCLWRNRDLEGSASAGQINDVAREVARVLASARDHFKVEVERVWLCVRPPLDLDVAGELSRRLARPVTPLITTPSKVLPEAERVTCARIGATFEGLVMNPS
jgi:hypothetical protein